MADDELVGDGTLCDSEGDGDGKGTGEGVGGVPAETLALVCGFGPGDAVECSGALALNVVADRPLRVEGEGEGGGGDVHAETLAPGRALAPGPESKDAGGGAFALNTGVGGTPRDATGDIEEGEGGVPAESLARARELGPDDVEEGGGAPVLALGPGDADEGGCTLELDMGGRPRVVAGERKRTVGVPAKTRERERELGPDHASDGGGAIALV